MILFGYLHSHLKIQTDSAVHGFLPPRPKIVSKLNRKGFDCRICISRGQNSRIFPTFFLKSAQEKPSSLTSGTFHKKRPLSPIISADRSFKLFNLNYFLNWVITTHIWNRFLFHQRPWHQLNSIYVLTYSPSCKQKAFRSLDMCIRSTHRTVRDFSIVRTLCVRHIPSTVKLSQSVVEVVTSSLSNPNPLWRILGQAWAWVWVRGDIWVAQRR